MYMVIIGILQKGIVLPSIDLDSSLMKHVCDRAKILSIGHL